LQGGGGRDTGKGELGITDGFFRLSLDFEDPQEVIASLRKALR